MEVDRHDDSIRIGESRLPKLLQIGLIRNYGNTPHGTLTYSTNSISTITFLPLLVSAR